MKKLIYKSIVLTILFVITFFYLSDLSRQETRLVMSEMPTSSLPLVRAREGFTTYNNLHGYREPMNFFTITEPFTLIKDSKVIFDIDKNDNKITSIEFEIYNQVGKVIERGQLDKQNVEENEKQIQVMMPIKESLDEDKNYQMALILNTKDKGKVYYYTNLVNIPGLYIMASVDEMINFHKGTFKRSQEVYVDQFLIKPKGKVNNSIMDLGYVNLNSPLETVMWGPLEVVKMNEPVPRLIGISEEKDALTYELRYVIAARMKGQLTYFNVKEKYELKKKEESYQIQQFERKTLKILDKDSIDMEEYSIKLGVLPDDQNTNIYASPNEQYYALLQERQLWLYDQKRNKLVNVFSFDQINSDYVLDTYDQHQIQVINVDNTGNIVYMISGYMNTGLYEGYNGVWLNEYENVQQLNSTKVFIPFKDSFKDLPYYFTHFNYLNENKIWSFIYQDKLYGINLEAKTYEILHQGLPLDREDLYISNDQSIIGWQERKDRYNQKVKFINLNTMENHEITTNSDERLKILGFMNNNILVGYAKIENIFESLDGQLTFPMYLIEIHNDHNEVVRVYDPGEGRLVTEYNIDFNRLNLTRVRMTRTNYNNPTENKVAFEPVDNDFVVYMNKVEQKIYQINKQENEEGYFEYFFRLGKKALIERPEYALAKHKVYQIKDKIIIDFEKQAYETYKVYGNGKLITFTDNLAAAIEVAKEVNGKVYNYQHQLVWEIRKRDISKIISGVPVVPQRPQLPRGCEVVSLGMILNYYGIPANKMELAEQIIKTPQPYKVIDNFIHYGDMHEGFVGNMHTTLEPGIGAYHEPVKELMGRYLPPQQILNLTGTSLGDLLYYVDEDTPIYINVANNYNSVPESSRQHWMTPNGIMEISFTEHAVVIVGYDKDYIYYNDPSRAIRDKKLRADFEKAYDQYGRQALAYLRE